MTEKKPVLCSAVKSITAILPTFSTYLDIKQAEGTIKIIELNL